MVYRWHHRAQGDTTGLSCRLGYRVVEGWQQSQGAWESLWAWWQILHNAHGLICRAGLPQTSRYSTEASIVAQYILCPIFCWLWTSHSSSRYVWIAVADESLGVRWSLPLIS